MDKRRVRGTYEEVWASLALIFGSAEKRWIPANAGMTPKKCKVNDDIRRLENGNSSLFDNGNGHTPLHS